MSLQRLKELVHNFPGEMAAYGKDLQTNNIVAINADTPFYLASVAKTLIMIGAVDAMAGQNELNHTHQIQLSDYREEGKHFRLHHLGTHQTYRELIRRMIRNSDTTATDMVVRIAGLENINHTLRNLNIPGLNEVTSIGELDRVIRAHRNDLWAGIPAWAFEPYTRNGIRDFLVPGFFSTDPPSHDATTRDEAFRDYYATQLNTATPRAMGRIAEGLAEKSLLDQDWKNAILRDVLFEAGREGRLGAAVPNVLQVDTKGGAKYGVRCELGVIYDSSRRTPLAVIGVFTQKLGIPNAHASGLIEEAATLVYQALGHSHEPVVEPPADPGLVFLDPPAGQLLEPGTSPLIRWQSKGIEGRLRLELIRVDRNGAEEVAEVLSSNAIDDGEWHSWTVSPDADPGVNYRLKLTSLQDNTVQTYSQYFALRGSIRVTEPHLGESHHPGMLPKIRWSTVGVSGNLTIELYKGSVLKKTISSNARDDGEWHSWMVGEDLEQGDDYRIRVRSNEDPSVEGWGPYFTVGGKVVVEAPALGELIPIGSNPVLRWRTEHVDDNLRLELLKGEETRVEIISDNAIDDGEWHSWTVPANLADGNGYRVRVSSRSTPSIQGGSRYFQLGARLEWLLPTIEQVPFNGDAHARPHFFRYGETPTLAWRTLGELGGHLRLELLRGGIPVKVISGNAINDGEWHSWTVTQELSPSSDYRLRLTSLERAGVVALSHRFYLGAMIDIALPRDMVSLDPLTSISPGTTPRLLWRTDNVAGKLRLELYRRDDLVETIHSSARNDGEWHSWTVDDEMDTGDGYRLKLSSRENPEVFGLSPWFEIRS